MGVKEGVGLKDGSDSGQDSRDGGSLCGGGGGPP